MSHQFSLLILTLLTILTLCTAMYISEKRAEPRKRPFCNAFTGCGRKRSDLPPLSPQGAQPRTQGALPEQESLGTLLDLSAEPAVEDLSRQIMSEAKLWEAIQEANMEIARQREAQEGEGRCTLPNCLPF